ncbi:MAG: hypothetical protein GY807_16690 [Gammaproteobacteria bacterium]|nr:hypothetical protein [Gammaproteobacteria bacterium]
MKRLAQCAFVVGLGLATAAASQGTVPVPKSRPVGAKQPCIKITEDNWRAYDPDEPLVLNDKTRGFYRDRVEPEWDGERYPLDTFVGFARDPAATTQNEYCMRYEIHNTAKKPIYGVRWPDEKMWFGKLEKEGADLDKRALVVNPDSDPEPRLEDTTLRAFRKVEKPVRAFLPRLSMAIPPTPKPGRMAFLVPRPAVRAHLDQQIADAMASAATYAGERVPQKFEALTIPEGEFEPKLIETLLIVGDTVLSARSEINRTSENEISVASTVRLDGRSDFVYAPFLVALESSMFESSEPMTLADVAQSYESVISIFPDVREKSVFLENGDEYRVEQAFSLSGAQALEMVLVSHPVLIETNGVGADCFMAIAFVPAPYTLSLEDCPITPGANQ